LRYGTCLLGPALALAILGPALSMGVFAHDILVVAQDMECLRAVEREHGPDEDLGDELCRVWGMKVSYHPRALLYDRNASLLALSPYTVSRLGGTDTPGFWVFRWHVYAALGSIAPLLLFMSFGARGGLRSRARGRSPH